jgi:hypothetical protein
MNGLMLYSFNWTVKILREANMYISLYKALQHQERPVKMSAYGVQGQERAIRRQMDQLAK